MRRFKLILVLDFTASMGALRLQLRKKNGALVRQLFKLLGSMHLEIGIITVHDLHDEGDRDFHELLPTNDEAAILKFLETVPDARGNSSGEECYERAYHRIREWNLKSSSDTQVAVVFVGDSIPHGVMHRKNPERLDCLAEVRAFVRESGSKIYSVECHTWGGNGRFYQDLASIGDGVRLELDQFDHIPHIMLAVSAQLGGKMDAWRDEYVQQQNLSYAAQRAIDKIAGRRSTYTARNQGKAVASSGRFNVYTIEEKIAAADFFSRELGIEGPYSSHAGELFYAHESRATEELRPNHEVIIEDDRTGEMIMGSDARAMLPRVGGGTGIPYGTKGVKVAKNALKHLGYTIWIQSKSVGNSRHLEKGQRVMIDYNPSEGFGVRRAA